MSNIKVMFTRSKISITCERSCHKDTHVQYESSICSGLKVLAKVEGSSFCSRTHADGDTDTRASL